MPLASPVPGASWLVPTLETMLLLPPLFLSLLLLRPGARPTTTVLGVLCVVVLMTVTRWYLNLDQVGSLHAAVASALVLHGPSLATGGFVFWIIRRKGGNTILAAGLSAVATYIVHALAIFPAIIIFIMLGGKAL